MAGVFGGAVLLGTLVLAAAWRGGSVLVPVNAIGAWAVRWLQGAAPDAFTHRYPDALAVGIGTPLVVGLVLGAAFGAVLGRLPRDHPAAWGVLGALVMWAATWWRVLPALDPVFVERIGRVDWLAACLAFGLTLAWWVTGWREAARSPGETPPNAFEPPVLEV